MTRDATLQHWATEDDNARDGVSSDVPALDIAYKLAEYAGRGRLKLSTGKPVLPGRKQVYRESENGRAVRDTITRAGESARGDPLLRTVMREGRRLEAGRITIDEARGYAESQIRSLPAPVRGLVPADPGFPGGVSRTLKAFQDDVTNEVRREPEETQP